MARVHVTTDHLSLKEVKKIMSEGEMLFRRVRNEQRS